MEIDEDKPHRGLRIMTWIGIIGMIIAIFTALLGIWFESDKWTDTSAVFVIPSGLLLLARGIYALEL